MKLLTDFFEVKSTLKNPDNPKKNGEPTSQQQKVINSPLDQHMSIIACAGSGKTTTLINRIAFLINNKVHPTSIILTTFTRDAAKDMTKKLEKKIGKDNGVYVGTMDSLGLYFLRQYDALEDGMMNVGEFALHFLSFLRTNDQRKLFFSSKQYLFVDEFQDINELQFNIINEFYKNNVIIIGVGDDAQNIYTFRGSNVKYIKDFKKIFNAEQYFLTHNFRSTHEIVAVANECIEKAHFCIPKKMIPQAGFSGEKPEVRFFFNPDDQAEFILNKIYELKKSFPLEEICILCPINQMLYKIEERALICNIPISVIDNKAENVGNNGIKKGRVTLCTIHKSKGLEWDIVFVIGMNDEIFPAEKDMEKVEEARRLFYVATTRARKLLYYTFTPIGKSRKVSRFIGELPLTLINFIGYQKEFIEKSEDVHIMKKNGVVEKIENLQIEDISYLRRKNILPNITELQEFELHPQITLPKFVYDMNLLGDFGIFVDCLLTRELATRYNESPKNFSCQCCLADIHVDVISYKLYLDNIGLVEQYFAGQIKSLDPKIQLVVDRIMKNAKRYKINPLDVGVHPNSYLPKKFRIELQDSYRIYQDLNYKTKDIIQHIWNVSLCSQIVNNSRRKMLFINVQMDKVLEFGKNILENFPEELGYGNQILIHKHYTVPGLSGEIDFWKDGALFDIKMSHEKSVNLNWVMQLMCYKAMMNIEVKQFFIYNVLSGKAIEIPCIDEKRCQKLVEYLSPK